jgi:hypothetical protein
MVAHAINAHMARKVEYLLEEVRALQEAYTEATGRKRIPFRDDQRRRLARMGNSSRTTTPRDTIKGSVAASFGRELGQRTTPSTPVPPPSGAVRGSAGTSTSIVVRLRDGALRASGLYGAGGQLGGEFVRRGAAVRRHTALKAPNGKLRAVAVHARGAFTAGRGVVAAGPRGTQTAPGFALTPRCADQSFATLPGSPRIAWVVLLRAVAGATRGEQEARPGAKVLRGEQNAGHAIRTDQSVSTRQHTEVLSDRAAAQRTGGPRLHRGALFRRGAGGGAGPELHAGDCRAEAPVRTFQQGAWIVSTAGRAAVGVSRVIRRYRRTAG